MNANFLVLNISLIRVGASIFWTLRNVSRWRCIVALVTIHHSVRLVVFRQNNSVQFWWGRSILPWKVGPGSRTWGLFLWRWIQPGYAASEERALVSVRWGACLVQFCKIFRRTRVHGGFIYSLCSRTSCLGHNTQVNFLDEICLTWSLGCG